MRTTYPIVEDRLSNGLRVIASRDSSAPSVAVVVTYGAGSRADPAGRTGIAHLFEHLMFEGSGNVDAGEHVRLVQANGGVCNAEAVQDQAVYVQQVPRGALDLVLWLEADRLATLPDALTQSALDLQRQVAAQERHQRLGVPGGSIGEHVFGELFGGHPCAEPYAHLPIGRPADLDQVTLADLRGFFDRWYRPDNAVLSVVGDIDPEQVFGAAERYLGPIPARLGTGRGPADRVGDGAGNRSGEAAGRPVAASQRVAAVEPLSAPRRVELPEPLLPFDLLALAFRGPANSVNDAEIFAFDVALSILADGEHSRAWRRLVHTETLAQEVSASTVPMDRVSAGVITALAMPGVPGDAIESALVDELETLAEKGPSEAELRQARAAATRDILAGNAQLLGRAAGMGQFAMTFGAPDAINTQIERLKLVDADAVQRAAAYWLHPDHRATIACRPAPPL